MKLFLFVSGTSDWWTFRKVLLRIEVWKRTYSWLLSARWLVYLSCWLENLVLQNTRSMIIMRDNLSASTKNEKFSQMNFKAFNRERNSWSVGLWCFIPRSRYALSQITTVCALRQTLPDDAISRTKFWEPLKFRSPYRRAQLFKELLYIVAEKVDFCIQNSSTGNFKIREKRKSSELPVSFFKIFNLLNIFLGFIWLMRRSLFWKNLGCRLISWYMMLWFMEKEFQRIWVKVFCILILLVMRSVTRIYFKYFATMTKKNATCNNYIFIIFLMEKSKDWCWNVYQVKKKSIAILIANQSSEWNIVTNILVMRKEYFCTGKRMAKVGA